jgi:hypothetical protein
MLSASFLFNLSNFFNQETKQLARVLVEIWLQNVLLSAMCFNSLAGCFGLVTIYSTVSTSFVSLLFAFRIGNEIYCIPESTQKQEGQREAGSEINQHNKSADINMNYGVCDRVFALQILIAGFTTVCGNTFAFACAQYVGCCVMNSIKRTR